MSVLFEFSPILSRTASEVQTTVEKFLAEIPSDRAEDFRRYRERFSARPEADGSLIHWLVINYFLRAGFLQGRIRIQDRTILSLGINLWSWEDEEVSPSGTDRMSRRGIQRLHVVGKEQGRRLELEGFVPDSLIESARSVLNFEILPLVRNYFRFQDLADEWSGCDLWRAVWDICHETLNQAIPEGRPVTFTHFRFQDLSLYFEVSGEHRTGDIIEEICKTIRTHTKNSDQVIRLSPLSYLAISPGARRDQIEARFQSIYFQPGMLILDYDLHVYTVDRLPVRLEEVWRELRL